MASNARGMLSLSRDLYWDPTWQELPAGAQALYLVIMADPFTTRAGTAPITLRRWSNQSGDQTVESTEAHLDALIGGGRAITDDDPIDPHVLLPKLLVDTCACTQPNVIAGAIRAAKDCRSAFLKNVFAEVIADLPVRESGLAVGILERRKSRPPIRADVRRAVYERDGWTCCDCGHRILPSTEAEASGERAPFDDVTWLELDHVHPYSEGGEDTVGNLRALCSRCNRIKGVRRIVQVDAASEVHV